jgi:hypothetical protein
VVTIVGLTLHQLELVLAADRVAVNQVPVTSSSSSSHSGANYTEGLERDLGTLSFVSFAERNTDIAPL